MSFWTYMLRCADGSYYVGHTDELDTRIAAHQSGALAGYTQDRRPVTLAWSQDFGSRDEALAAERQIKGWSRAKKEALIAGDWERVSLLARKSFDTPVRQAHRLLRTNGKGISPPQDPVILSRGPSEVEGPVSKDAPQTTTKPVIVLVRPQLGQNIGKAARAMLNFGLVELRLVAPRDGWPNPEAGPAASGADVVLERAEVFGTVAEAVADCSAVYASTVRRRDLMMPVVGPEEMARDIRAFPGRAAILFGPERSGLETEDVALATAIVTVPINPEFGSLNLAQAVILLAYEWSRGSGLAQPPAKELEPPAEQRDLDGLVGQLEQHLDAVHYFHPPERTTATKQTIRTILTKARWSSREIKAVRGMLRAIAEPRRP